MRTALDHARDQPGVLEHAEMPAQRRLRHGEAAGRLAYRRRPEREPLDDSTTDRMRKRLKRTVSHLANNLLHSPTPATQEVHPAAPKQQERISPPDPRGMASRAVACGGEVPAKRILLVSVQVGQGPASGRRTVLRGAGRGGC